MAGDGRGDSQGNNSVGSLPEPLRKHGRRIHAMLAPLPAPAMGALRQLGPAQGELVLQEVTTLWELARCSGLECDG